jgi:site-specific recombinase XerD
MKRTEALETLKDVIRRKHFSLATERSYLMWVNRYSDFVKDRCHMDNLATETKLEMFLTQLARQEVSASTQNRGGVECAVAVGAGVGMNLFFVNNLWRSFPLDSNRILC